MMHMDSEVCDVWQQAYGGTNGNSIHSNDISASATSDDGSFLPISKIFQQEFDGWLVKT